MGVFQGDLNQRRATQRDILNAALERGYRSLADDGIARVLEGVTSLSEVARVVDLTQHTLRTP